MFPLVYYFLHSHLCRLITNSPETNDLAPLFVLDSIYAMFAGHQLDGTVFHTHAAVCCENGFWQNYAIFIIYVSFVGGSFDNLYLYVHIIRK